MRLYNYPISKYFNLHFDINQFEVNIDNQEFIPPLQIEKYLTTCPIEFEILCDLLEYLNIEIPVDKTVTDFVYTRQYFENKDEQIIFKKMLRWFDMFNIRSDSDFLNTIGLLVFDYIDNTYTI